jgi:hypothetical protein
VLPLPSCGAFDPRARRLPGNHPLADGRRVGPWKVDDGARLLLDKCLRLVAEALRLTGLDRTVCLEARRVGDERIARAPVGVERLVDVAGVADRRVGPRRLRVLAQVEHVVVMRVPAHAHRDELD